MPFPSKHITNTSFSSHAAVFIMPAYFQFCLIMNWSYFWRVAPKFADAALITLKLSAYSIALSLLLGLAVAVVTAYRVRPLY